MDEKGEGKMSRSKCDDLDYIYFLVAAQKDFTCTEAARCQPGCPNAPAHDAFTRLLQRELPDTEALWQEVRPLINLKRGVLILDDTALDKPYAHKMKAVTWHCSGKHHRVVKGINLITTLWTDGKSHLPCDFRVYAPHLDGLTKNEHGQTMWAETKSRGFDPECVIFDSWYASLKNLKFLDQLGWCWLTRLKANRLVNPDGCGNHPISTVFIPEEGRVVHLKGYGWLKVFQKVAQDGDVEYWVTNNVDMGQEEWEHYAKAAWRIEEYHRGLKQCCGVERAQVRSAQAQIRHISLALQAFIRLEWHRLYTGLSWYEAKRTIIRKAIRNYLAYPFCLLGSPRWVTA
jgi:hypothetical protein